MSPSERSYSVAEAVRDLTIIADNQAAGDRSWEEHHEEADEILLRLINDSAITTAWERISKWYA